jgi:hypothetical protein
MYVVKVGEYYVRRYTKYTLDIDMTLSKEIMRGFDKETAENIAKRLNGEVIEITEEVSNE